MTTWIRFAVLVTLLVSAGRLLGGEYEGGLAQRPQLAADAAGNFVLVWSDRGEIFAQRHDAAGTPLGEAIRVNPDPPPVPGAPAPDVDKHEVSMAAGGAFVVSWETIGASREVSFRLYDAAGQMTAERAIPQAVRPAVSMAPGGSFALGYFNLATTSLEVQLFDVRGEPRANVIQVVQLPPVGGVIADSHVSLSESDVVSVVWETPSGHNVVLRRFRADGAPVHDAATDSAFGEVRDPALAASDDGTAYVAVEEEAVVCVPFRTEFSEVFIARRFEVRLAVFDDGGAVVAGDLTVNPRNFSRDPDPALAVDDEDRVTLVYAGAVGEVHQVLAWSWRPGEKLHGEARNLSAGISGDRENRNASIVVRADGSWVVAWESLIFDAAGLLTKTEVHFRIVTHEDDDDHDGVPQAADNCGERFNPEQRDIDDDGMGDACDADADADTVDDSADNCPAVANTAQGDEDADGVGDACDNCPQTANVDQADCDLDGRGEACDTCPQGSSCEPFVRGDTNLDGLVDLSDGVAIVNHLFLGGPAECRDAMDTDDDGEIVITDTVYLLNFLFLGGPSVPAPFPDPGIDVTIDALFCCACESFRWLLDM